MIYQPINCSTMPWAYRHLPMHNRSSNGSHEGRNPIFTVELILRPFRPIWGTFRLENDVELAISSLFWPKPFFWDCAPHNICCFVKSWPSCKRSTMAHLPVQRLVMSTLTSASALTSANIAGSGVVSATIGDLVWLDENSNGIQDANEAGIGGVEVTATCSGSSTSATASTDERGNYFFIVANPAAAPIILTFAPPAGHALTRPGQGTDRTADSDPDPTTGQTGPITLSAGAINNDQDAGLIRTVAVPAICGTVYNDLVGNGQIDQATPALATFQLLAIPVGSPTRPYPSFHVDDALEFILSGGSWIASAKTKSRSSTALFHWLKSPESTMRMRQASAKTTFRCRGILLYAKTKQASPFPSPSVTMM